MDSLAKCLVTLGDKNPAKTYVHYECKLCDFKSSNKNDYSNHLLTNKHKLRLISDIGDTSSLKTREYICPHCDKKYLSRNGLWKHKKICIDNSTNKKTQLSQDNDSNNIVEKLTDIIMNVIKQNQNLISQNFDVLHQTQDTLKQNMELTNKITDMCKNQIITTGNTGTNNSINTGNNATNNSHNNNKTFNLNFFLNDTCKNAINMSDFINNLELKIEDLERLDTVGYVAGSTQVVMQNVNQMEVTERPMHCVDKKRETVYVKEEGKWEQDNNLDKMRKLVKKATHKNYMQMCDKFPEKYPNYQKSDSSHSDLYDRLTIESLGGSDKEVEEEDEKIIKNLIKEIVVNKTNYLV